MSSACDKETIEASLQLSEAALVGLGRPAGPVIASIHEKRDEIRRTLPQAAGKAGLQKIHAVRQKTLRAAGDKGPQGERPLGCPLLA